MIVHYTNVGALQICLTALEQQVAPEDEILVVDNQGSPAVAALVSGVAQARLFTPGRNLGYGAGNNLAAASARGRYLMILNPDVAPRPAFLRHMAAALDGLPELALVTATLLLPDGRVNALGNNVTYAGITTCRGLGELHVPGDVYPVPAISGAALALRRSAFHTLGGFDEQFFLYLEDTDLALRALLRGGSCWCAGDAVAIHDYRWRFPPIKQLELEKNRLQLLLKVYRRETLLALLPGLLLVELCTIVYAALRGPAHLRAKLRAYVLVFEDRHGLRARRRRLQAERLVGDDIVLLTCRWRIPFRQQLGPRVGTAVEWLLAPAFYLPYAAARALAQYQAGPRRWAAALLT